MNLGGGHIRDINEFIDAKSVIIIVLAILMIIAVVLCVGKAKALTDMNALIHEEETVNTAYQDEIANLRKAQDEQGKNTGDEDAMYQKMPQEPDEAGVISSIQNLCIETSSELSDLQFETRTQQQTYLEMPFTFTIATNYWSLISFLQGLKESERFFMVTGLQAASDQGLGILKVTVNACAYSYSVASAEVSNGG